MGGKTRVETLDRDYLKERLRYDLMTGKFTWKKHPSKSVQWNGWLAGKEAGSVGTNAGGYKCAIIGLDGRLYRVSHLAWFYMLNRWPIGEVDHINHNPADNRWINLRESTSAENLRNKSKYKNNTSGITGVIWHEKQQKWRARIAFNKRHIHGGYFDSFEEAVARRKELEIQYDFHPNHGRERQ
jgi:hypothetical protein